MFVVKVSLSFLYFKACLDFVHIILVRKIFSFHTLSFFSSSFFTSLKRSCTKNKRSYTKRIRKNSLVKSEGLCAKKC